MRAGLPGGGVDVGRITGTVQAAGDDLAGG